jgi:hypothetical protein
VLQFVRSLGNAGAIANAATLASTRRRETWVVAALARATVERTPTVPARRTA